MVSVSSANCCEVLNLGTNYVYAYLICINVGKGSASDGVDHYLLRALSECCHCLRSRSAIRAPSNWRSGAGGQAARRPGGQAARRPGGQAASLEKLKIQYELKSMRNTSLPGGQAASVCHLPLPSLSESGGSSSSKARGHVQPSSQQAA